MSVLHDVKLMHINFSCNFQAISRVAGEARSLLSIGYECCRLETQLRPEATSFAELLKAQMQNRQADRRTEPVTLEWVISGELQIT